MPAASRAPSRANPRPRGVTRRQCLAGLASPLLWGWRSATVAAAARPNILFVMLDTLRADHVGCYGYAKPTTPHIDRLARESVRFANLYTAGPWTMPSVMTMFTSLHPTVHGAVSFQRRASLKVTTLAERLKRLGYRHTVAIVSNPTVNSRYGFAQGFDRYDDYSIFFAHELDLFGVDDKPQRKSVVEAVTSKTVTDMATRWLEKEGRRGPWFLFLLYFDPHLDYVPSLPGTGASTPIPPPRTARPSPTSATCSATTPTPACAITSSPSTTARSATPTCGSASSSSASTPSATPTTPSSWSPATTARSSSTTAASSTARPFTASRHAASFCCVTPTACPLAKW